MEPVGCCASTGGLVGSNNPRRVIPTTAITHMTILVLCTVMVSCLLPPKIGCQQTNTAQQTQNDNKNSRGAERGWRRICELWDLQRRWRSEGWHACLSRLNIECCRKRRVNGGSDQRCGRRRRLNDQQLPAGDGNK